MANFHFCFFLPLLSIANALFSNHQSQKTINGCKLIIAQEKWWLHRALRNLNAFVNFVGFVVCQSVQKGDLFLNKGAEALLGGGYLVFWEQWFGGQLWHPLHCLKTNLWKHYLQYWNVLVIEKQSNQTHKFKFHLFTLGLIIQRNTNVVWVFDFVNNL